MKLTRILVILSVLTVVAALQIGCGDKDVPFVVDADELIRYVTEEEYAKELFRTVGLFNPDSYELSFVSGQFRDSVIGKTRSIETFLVPLDRAQDQVYVDHGNPLGLVREALVRVSDRFTIQVSRTHSGSVSYDTAQVTIDRFGFFLKLGGDSRPYVGWLLYGFNGVGTLAPPLSVELVSSSGTEFRGDLGLYPDKPQSHESYIPEVYYIRLAEIDTVTQGSRLHITTTKTSYGFTPPTTQLISDYDPDGPFTRVLHRYDSENYIDSLSYETVTGNPLFYNLVFFQSFSDSTHLSRRAFAVPYRW